MQINTFKSAGLASLMTLQFNRTPANNVNANEYLRRNWTELRPIDLLMNNADLFIDKSAIRQKIAYAEAGSFYDYLIRRDGLEKFREFYRQDLDGIEGKYGAPVDSLDAQWRRWLFGKATSDTVAFH